MITSTLTLGLLGALAAPAPDDPTKLPSTYALRVGRAETVANGPVEHAVLLVENGKITVVGEDLPVERGIPTFDHPDWVVMPGLVSCRTRYGLSGRGPDKAQPEIKASDELYPPSLDFSEVVEAGVTTLGFHPPGEGIPGQAVCVRPRGKTLEDLVLRDPAYLLIELRTSKKSKRMVMDGFEEADEYEEEVKEEREDWKKDLERQEKRDKRKKDDDDEDEEEDDEDRVPETFTPEPPDPDVKPFLDLRSGELSALVDVSKASDYVHWLDALGDEEIAWSLYCNLRNDIDLFEVAERIGEDGRRIVLTPEITLQPFTRRDRNLPAELAAAGAKVALAPRSDSSSSYGNWRTDVGNLIRFGLDRDVALRGMTLEPAEVLGVADRLGSLEPGKDANLVLFDGDPFEPATRIRMVILEGENVYEYEAPTTGEDEDDA